VDIILLRYLHSIIHFEAHFKINASEQRTADQLVERLTQITQTESLPSSTTDSKPNLLLLDEVDGALESESFV